MLPLILLAVVVLVVISNLVGILIGFQKGWEAGQSAHQAPNRPSFARRNTSPDFTLLKFETSAAVTLDINEPGMPSHSA